MNYEIRITETIKLNLKFKLSGQICHYSYAYILVSKTITIFGEGDNDAAKRADERNIGAIFKNCAPFTDCTSNINNAPADNIKYIDVVMAMFDLIECCDNYSKTSRSLWQYHRDVPAKAIQELDSFKRKIKITGTTPDNDNKQFF